MSTSDTITVAGDGSGAIAIRRMLDPALVTGDLVGRYVVIARVGAGGMGVVYAAYDPDLDRKVAVKLLGTDQADDARARRQQRLLREAKAMAKVDHPNVVTVYDVGTHGDRVYVAMEFVDGQTLAVWRRGRARGWREVLDVFIAAGRGLAAAHQRGLVHRDFKPDNVMVGVGNDGGSRVRVMDFGLASIAEGNSQTSSGGSSHAGSEGAPLELASPPDPATAIDVTHRGMAGTPAYMAPETLRRAPVDAAADQFSFCVALWETLFGRHPFAGQTQGELAANVMAGNFQPPPPGRAVPPWLRRACLVGLAAEPTQRFADMHALVAALERGHARTWWMRALVAGAGIVAVGAGLVWHRSHARERVVAACVDEGESIAKVWGDARRDELRARLAESNVAGADGAAARVTPWLDAHARAWAAARTDACLLRQDDPAWDDERSDRAMWCLDDRSRELDELVNTLARADKGAVLRGVQAAAGLVPVAPCLDADFTRRLPAPAPSERDEVAAVHRELFRADALFVTGAFDEGLEVARAAAIRAEQVEWPPLVAASGLRVGELLEATGEYAEAERALEDAYFQAASAGAPDVAIAAARSLVYIVGYRQSRSSDAMRWWRQADALGEQLPDPSGIRRGVGLATLAMLHRLDGEYATAQDVAVRAIALLEAALGPDHPEVAGATNGMASGLDRAGKHAEARAVYQRVLETLERTLGPDHPDVAMCLDNLGGVAMSTGDHASAVELRTRALRIREQVLGTEHPDVGTTLAHLAAGHRAQGDHARALAMLERALEIQQRALGPDSLDVARSLTSLAGVHRSMGNHDAARPLLERALRIAEHELGAEHPEVAYPLLALAETELKRGDTSSARSRFERAKRLIEATSNPEHPLLVGALEPLAEIALADGRAEDAIVLGERAVELAAREEELRPTRLAANRFVLAQALARAGRDPVRAGQLATQARDAYAAAGDDHRETVARVDAWLAAR